MLGNDIMSVIAVGCCFTACNAARVACYATAGLVAGTVTAGAAIPAAAVACNAGQGLCMGACSAGAVTLTAAPLLATPLAPVVLVGGALAAVVGGAWNFLKHL